MLQESFQSRNEGRPAQRAAVSLDRPNELRADFLPEGRKCAESSAPPDPYRSKRIISE